MGIEQVALFLMIVCWTNIGAKKIDLVSSQYSGNKHGVVDGIGMINALWRDIDSGEYAPVDFRIYNKQGDGKTTNDHILKCYVKRLHVL